MFRVAQNREIFKKGTVFYLSRGLEDFMEYQDLPICGSCKLYIFFFFYNIKQVKLRNRCTEQAKTVA